MHPKNIFQLRPMATFLGALLLFSGPCQLLDAWSTKRVNNRLGENGVERMATVVALSGGARIAAKRAKTGSASCRWEVQFEEVRCVEIFALPCPKGVTETPVIFLPDDPQVCRVLSRLAVLEDRRSDSQKRLPWLLILGGILLLAVARSRFFSTNSSEESR
jgi:hypothetical protein